MNISENQKKIFDKILSLLKNPSFRKRKSMTEEQKEILQQIMFNEEQLYEELGYVLIAERYKFLISFPYDSDYVSILNVGKKRHPIINMNDINNPSFLSN